MEENGPLSNACNDHEHAEVGLKKQKLSKKTSEEKSRFSNLCRFSHLLLRVSKE